MKKVQFGLMVIGMMSIGQFNAQESQEQHHPVKGDFFAKMDTNKDGAITLDEMKARDGDEAKKEARFKKMDANSDGKITKEEMEKMHANHQKMKENRLSPDERFAKMDKNSDGAITLDEMPGKDEAVKAERFKKMDTNGDGRVTQEELSAKRASHDGNKKCSSDCKKGK